MRAWILGYLSISMLTLALFVHPPFEDDGD